MIFIAIVLWIIFLVVIQTILSGNQAFSPIDSENLTIASLISDSELDSWLSDPVPKTTPLIESTLVPLKEDHYFVNTSDSAHQSIVITSIDNNNNVSIPSLDSTWDQQLRDDPLISSVENIVDLILTEPKSEIDGDWSVVLGAFSHYHDEQWNEFLIRTEVPLLVRLYLSDSSETVYISRIFDKRKPKKSIEVKKKKKKAVSDSFQVLIATSSWLLTHDSQFTLGQTYIEHDLDGTDSKNTFFFASPRLLIHHKIKDSWKTTIIRHFDENGLNMTFIDTERLVVARRYLKRIS